jgi:hypothetical protein
VATPKFKFEGKARQYEFNSSRIDEVSKARAFVEPKRIAAAEKILDQCETALKERNKSIRIADKYGWDVVEEYVDYPLTDCTDDAKKLRQAEYSAKLKRKDKGRHNNRYNPYYKNQDNSDKNTADLFRGSSPTRQGETPGASSRNTARHVYTGQSITEAKKQQEITSAFIETLKDTGHISVPGNPGFQQENPTDKTVKYTFNNLHNQDYEYENELNVSAFHVGSLNKKCSFWKDTIKATNLVLNVISSGYLIPFFKIPKSVNLRNNGSAFKHSSFVEQAIYRLLKSGATFYRMLSIR